MLVNFQIVSYSLRVIKFVSPTKLFRVLNTTTGDEMPDTIYIYAGRVSAAKYRDISIVLRRMEEFRPCSYFKHYM